MTTVIHVLINVISVFPDSIILIILVILLFAKSIQHVTTNCGFGLCFPNDVDLHAVSNTWTLSNCSLKAFKLYDQANS